MKNNVTEIVFLLDRSGSMLGLEEDTIGGFNSLLERQKKEEGKALLSTVLFDQHFEVLHDRLPLEVVPLLTAKDYYVRGTTALLDAIGRSIVKISTTHMAIEKEAKPDRTLFVITTDGYENASQEFTYEKLRNIINHKIEMEQWEFLFLGANIDAFDVGSRLGIDKSKVANYHADSVGTHVNYNALSDAISDFRVNKSVSASWKEKIDEDYTKRKKKS
jgi:uncharacterized protein YegL